jgi:predicted metal-dependent TIM-barrel fold hydrolase
LLLASLEQLEKYKEKKMLLNASIESYYSDIQSLSHERDSLKEKFEEKVEERAKYQNDKEVSCESCPHG